jgi:uncharacterized SAM-binding protein YcdF (DUF218 family)
MDSSWLATQIVSALLLPPLNLVLPALAGFLLRRRWPRAGPLLCGLSLAILLGLCTGAGARLLTVPLVAMTAPLPEGGARGAQAIVVLGGGRIPAAPEYGGADAPSQLTLARLRYAATLQKQTGLPVLVTGGAPDGAGESEASVMARTLRQDFAVPVKWIEPASANTAQNARYSARILAEARVKRILLVTDAMHMPRAHQAFIHAGLEVTPAPTGFPGSTALGPLDFVPNGHVLGTSRYAMHEWIGMLWYRLRRAVH